MTASMPPLTTAPWVQLRAQGAFVIQEPPLRPLKPRRRSGRTAWLAAAVATPCLVVAVLPRPDPATPPRPAPPKAEPAAPVWHDVANPFVAYDLAGGAFAKLPLDYAARRDHASEAREDTLTYGAPDPGEAFLRVAFLRRGDTAPVETSVFLDAVRLAARAGLAVTRSGLASRIDTRFGPFETAGVAVERAGRSADCLAFRLADPVAAPVLAITGLACGTVEHPVDLVTLACTLDRLDLVSAGDDEALRAVFVAAERRRREGCAVQPPVPLRFGAADRGERRDAWRWSL